MRRTPAKRSRGCSPPCRWVSGDVCHHRADVQLAEKCVAIWLTVPLALIGVTPGFLITGIPFGFMALIGLLSLSGMLIRNGIVLVEEIEQQKQEKAQHERLSMPQPRACALYCSRPSPPCSAWRRCCWMSSSRVWRWLSCLGWVCDHSDATGSSGDLRLFPS
jgi:hypothetical protein